TGTITPQLAGQSIDLSFTATAGQRIALSFSSYVTITLIRPDGSTSYSQRPGSSFGPIALDQSGQYQLKVLGTVGTTTTVQLRSVPPDPTATATIDGSAVTLTFTAAGQNGVITFQGTAGQRVNIG